VKPDSSVHDLLIALLLVQNAMSRCSELLFQRYELTDAQFNILNLLAQSDGPMNQLALTEKLLVGKSTVSIVLNRMAKAGLIERQEHPRDRRKVVLSLSLKGREIWQKANPDYERTVEQIFGALPKRNRERFIDDLDVLYAELRQTMTSSSAEKQALTLRQIVAQLSE
jgi:MarR family transcriptional regulator, organic hydroperoxide resistance regulator